MLLYLLKSTFCLVLLLGMYHLFLEKEKMHRFNRFYLLGSILFSLLVPTISITVAPNSEATVLLTEVQPTLQTTAEAMAQQPLATPTNYTAIIIAIYLLVSAILCTILLKKIHKLLAKASQNKQLNYFSATVVLLKERIVPYTFLHYIFVNKFTYQTANLEQQILTHELAHVEQKHSLDVLFVEILQNLCWFNPIFRYYKKAIQLNHEFLADDAVINSHKNISEYQQVLLNTTAQNNNIYLASNLNYSLTKKRLLMMTTPSSNTKILLKKLLVAPLVAGAIFAFAQRVEAQEDKNTPQTTEVNEAKNGISDAEMKEYNGLITKATNSKIFFYKELLRMKDLYSKMSASQQQSVTNIYNISPPVPQINRKKKTPSTKQFTAWKNKEKYAIWIDGKATDNKELNKYQPTDFAYFTGSKVAKNARNKKYPQEFQYSLYTHTSFNKMKKKDLYLNTKSIAIYLNKDGSLLVQNKTVQLSNLTNTLAQLVSDKAKTQVFITSAPEFVYKKRQAAALKKILTDVGFTKINWNTPPPPKPQILEVTPQEKELSKKGMRLYKTLFSKGKTTKHHAFKLYKHEDVKKMIALYKAMSKQQQQQVTDIRKVLPPPPPRQKSKKLKEVKPVKIEVVEKQKKHKKKLKEYKKKHGIKELVEVREIIDKKELVEVREVLESKEPVVVKELLIEAEEMPEVVEVLEEKELKEVVELVEEVEVPVVVEIQENPVVTSVPTSKSKIDLVKIFAKRGATFTFNNKKISARRAIRLATSNKNLHIYPVKNKDKTIQIHLSTTPFVKEIKKQ